jgi:hypothetical protein
MRPVGWLFWPWLAASASQSARAPAVAMALSATHLRWSISLPAAVSSLLVGSVRLAGSDPESTPKMFERLIKPVVMGSPV